MDFPEVIKVPKYKIWNENHLLEYDDFMADRDSTFLTYNQPSDAVAVTEISVCMKENRNHEIDYVVINKFDRRKSWMTNKTEYCLNHEQIHFDISELYARKMRKKITNLKANNIHDMDIYKVAMAKLLNERGDYQSLYDTETRHSLLETEQSRWDHKVKKELSALQEYSSDFKHCSCKAFDEQRN